MRLYRFSYGLLVLSVPWKYLFVSKCTAGVCLADPAAWISALVPLIPYYIYTMRKWEKQRKEQNI